MGIEYAETRHNIGFKVVDAFAEASTSSFNPSRYADVCEARVRGRTFVLIKPSTFMNLSGKAVRYWLEQLKLPLERLLIIADDIALPTGTLRLRPKGSDGGHNGLKSINEMLGTNQYARLRIGVGDDFLKGQQVDFVLGKWTEPEKKIIDSKIKTCVDIIRAFGTMDIQLVMSRYNKKG